MAVTSSHSSSATRLYGDFDITAPGANTGITGGVSFSTKAAVARVTIALTTSSVVNATCTDGSTTHKWGLNESAALNAADLYTFTFEVLAETAGGTALTYDIEVESDGVIEKLIISEVQGGVI